MATMESGTFGEKWADVLKPAFEIIETLIQTPGRDAKQCTEILEAAKDIMSAVTACTPTPKPSKPIYGCKNRTLVVHVGMQPNPQAFVEALNELVKKYGGAAHDNE